MARKGDTIRNIRSGETITFVRTTEDSGGEAVEMLFTVTPGGAPAAVHVHPRQTERFDVHEGCCRVAVEGEERFVEAGDSFMIPAGAAHVWSAVTDLRMTVTLEPALDGEAFFEDLFALCNAGPVNAKGLPGPLSMAVLAHDHRETCILASPPPFVQRVVFSVLARIGRALGHGAANLPAPVAELAAAEAA
ncbi:MAG TPA: cupin domain-containing protein [Baekduia sp.]|nr:cupin domain-containing protein [Baekduia sp.]